MYINPQMSVYVYRFKNKYHIAKRLVIADRLVIKAINTTEYRFFIYLFIFL